MFVNAYANPANELKALAAAREVWPNDNIECSAQILPEIREFERTSTTALNAYLQPVVGSYLGKLDQALAQESFSGRFHIVQSNGGVMSTATARRLPVRTALSGPAAGVIAAAAIAKAAGFPDVITLATSAAPPSTCPSWSMARQLAAQTTIDFGLVIRTPMIEIATIGAGGGSIAHVDAGGLLQVGPESAGSRPGPVAYGQGNTRPTLTDANVVLGRINAERPIGGKLARLDVEAAKDAIARHVAEPLGLRPDARGGGHRACCQRQDGRRHPSRVHRARARSGSLCGRSVRRRRSPSCGRTHQGRGTEGGARPALSWRDVRTRLCHRRHPARSSADGEPAPRQS